MKKINLVLSLGVLIGASILTSCQDDFEKKIKVAGADSTGSNYGAPKVLYIIVDGARGLAVRDAKPENINKLLVNSTYAWNSISEDSLGVSGWASMVTGVKSAKHMVKGNDLAGNKLEDYPVIFKRLKTANPNMKIAAYASTALFKEKFTEGADVSENKGSDAAVKDALIGSFQNDTASVIVGEFKGVDIAGQTGGYGLDNPGYKAAIKQMDDYIGEIMAALKAKKDYFNENWLVVITSNKGGAFNLPASQNTGTIFSNTYFNTFTILYNQKFYRSRFVNTPFLGYNFFGKTVRLHGRDGDAVRGFISGARAEDLNFGDGDFTVQMKVKKLINPLTKDANYEWPAIFGKRSVHTHHRTGWGISLYWDRWGIHIGNDRGTNGGGTLELKAAQISPNVWHDIAMVCDTRSDGRYVSLFTDGVLKFDPGNGGGDPYDQDNFYTNNGGIRKPNGQFAPFVLNKRSISNDNPLILGWTPGDNNGDRGIINFQIAEVKMFNAALPDSVIRNTACDPELTEAHPFFGNLMAYWPLRDGSGNKFKDIGPLNIDFDIQGPFVWEDFSDLLCAPATTNLTGSVPNSADIATQILSWFKIARQENWGLDGRVWINQ